MEREENETDEDIIKNTIETIKTVENIELCSDLLAVMSILAGDKFTSELVKKYVRNAKINNLCAQYKEYRRGNVNEFSNI